MLVELVVLPMVYLTTYDWMDGLGTHWLWASLGLNNPGNSLLESVWGWLFRGPSAVSLWACSLNLWSMLGALHPGYLSPLGCRHMSSWALLLLVARFYAMQYLFSKYSRISHLTRSTILPNGCRRWILVLLPHSGSLSWFCFKSNLRVLSYSNTSYPSLPTWDGFSYQLEDSIMV